MGVAHSNGDEHLMRVSGVIDMGEYDTSTGLMVGYYLLLVLKGVCFCRLCAYNSENLRVCMGFWPLCV